MHAARSHLLCPAQCLATSAIPVSFHPGVTDHHYIDLLDYMLKSVEIGIRDKPRKVSATAISQVAGVAVSVQSASGFLQNSMVHPFLCTLQHNTFKCDTDFYCARLKNRRFHVVLILTKQDPK